MTCLSCRTRWSRDLLRTQMPTQRIAWVAGLWPSPWPTMQNNWCAADGAGVLGAGCLRAGLVWRTTSFWIFLEELNLSNQLETGYKSVRINHPGFKCSLVWPFENLCLSWVNVPHGNCPWRSSNSTIFGFQVSPLLNARADVSYRWAGLSALHFLGLTSSANSLERLLGEGQGAVGWRS